MRIHPQVTSEYLWQGGQIILRHNNTLIGATEKRTDSTVAVW